MIYTSRHFNSFAQSYQRQLLNGAFGTIGHADICQSVASSQKPALYGHGLNRKVLQIFSVVP